MMSRNSTLRCPASTIYSTAEATSPDIASLDSVGLSIGMVPILFPGSLTEGTSRPGTLDLSQSPTLAALRVGATGGGSIAHPAPRPAQSERPVWCSRRVPPRCHSPEPQKAGKADPTARPTACPSTHKLTRAWLLAPSRTVRLPTSSTRSARNRHCYRSVTQARLLAAEVGAWDTCTTTSFLSFFLLASPLSF